MGRAIVRVNLGEGLYRVTYKLERGPLDDELARIEILAPDMSNAITEKENEFFALTVEVEIIYGEIDAIILNGSLTSQEKSRQVNAKLREVAGKVVQQKGVEAALSRLYTQQQQLVDRQTLINQVVTEETKEVWIADYSPSIQPSTTEHEIGALEVPGDNQQVILAPANNTTPESFNAGNHGNMTPALAMSPSGYFSAAAMMPGWQRFKPTYRVGVVLAKNVNGTMRIGLSPPNTSRYSLLPITPTAAQDMTVPDYESVPVRYMDCNAAAFRVGDKVLIEYIDRDPKRPRVIGFADHPQPCGAKNFYSQLGDRLRPIRNSTAWARTEQPGALYGNAHWFGASKAVSWHGYSGRYFKHTGDTTGQSVFYGGQDYGPTPGYVLGAAIVGDYMLAVCQDLVVSGEDYGVDRLYAMDMRTDGQEWLEIANYPIWNGGGIGAAGSIRRTDNQWFFHEDGLQAVSSRWALPTADFTEWRHVYLTVSLTGGTISAYFTLGEQPTAEYVETGPNFSTTDCGSFVGVLPHDCTSDAETHYRVTKYGKIVDYVGNSTVWLDEVEELDSISSAAYGPEHTACLVGSPKPPETVTQSAGGTLKKRLVCSALNIDITTLHQVSSSLTTGGTVACTDPSAPLGCRPYDDFTNSASLTNNADMIEYLNVTGGLGAVVTVLRSVNATYALSGGHRSPAAGPSNPALCGDFVSSSETIVGTLALRLWVGTEVVDLGTADLAENDTFYQDSGSTTDDESPGYDAALEAINGVVTSPGRYAANREGAAIASVALTERTGAVPSLPSSAFAGNLVQFYTLGVG